LPVFLQIIEYLPFLLLLKLSIHISCAKFNNKTYI
jgi:hypothetical protein